MPHHPGARYRDAWNERDLGPRITDDGKAEIRLEIGAGEVGCVIQSW